MMVSGKFNREEAAWKNHIFTGLTADLIFRATIRVIADRDLLLFGYAKIEEALTHMMCYIIAEKKKVCFQLWQLLCLSKQVTTMRTQTLFLLVQFSF